MKTLIIAAFVTVGIAGTAFAQQRTVRDMVTEMQAKYGQTFEACQTLAASRGYRLSGDDEVEGRAVAMFILGCIMGRQT
jgi:hypothetical protein